MLPETIATEAAISENTGSQVVAKEIRVAPPDTTVSELAAVSDCWIKCGITSFSLSVLTTLI